MSHAAPQPESYDLIRVRNGGSFLLCFVSVGCGRIGFDTPSMLSCEGLPSTCGPTGGSACCGTSLVPGGIFYRSYDVGTDNAYPDMTNPATISDFKLDIYEVTVGRFRKFVNAGLGTQQNPPPNGAGARTLSGMANQGGWDTTFDDSLVADSATLAADLYCDATHQSWTATPGANESLPINCITWFEAMAFCTWDGGFLPTEAEWNYAAAGGNEQRAYPWSSPPSSLTIDCSYANYDDLTGFCTNPPIGAVNRVGSESPKGDGKWGHADLAGNVYEWTLDWFDSAYVDPCDDCAELTPALDRGIRGGSLFFDASALRGAVRGFVAPPSRINDVGVRCARDP